MIKFGRVKMQPRFAYNVYKSIAMNGIKHKAKLSVKKKKNVFTVSCSKCQYICKYRMNPSNMVYILEEIQHTCTASEDEPIDIFYPYIREAASHAGAKFKEPTPHQIRGFICNELQITEDKVKIEKVYSAMRCIRAKDDGDGSINLLTDFAKKFNETNAGRIILNSNEDNELSAIYIEFNYATQFAGLDDQLFFLDGTHTKSGMESCILVIAAATGFETVLPVSMLWCLKENTENTSLLFKLSESIIRNRPVFKTDAAKCFERVIHSVNCDHSLCIHHLLKNLRYGTYTIINDMINAATVDQFNSLCDELQLKSPRTWEKLESKLDHYFRLAGEPRTFLYRASSPIESLNSAIIKARSKRYTEMIVALIEWGDRQLVKIKQIIQDSITNRLVLTQRALKEVNERESLAREGFSYEICNQFAYVRPNSHSKDHDMTNVVTHHCMDPPAYVYTSKPRNEFQRKFLETSIPIGEPWCTCQEFLSSGLPCIHQCLVYDRREMEGVASPFWKVSTYEFLLSVKRHEIPCVERLSIIPIKSAQQTPQPGRPRKKRLISTYELEISKKKTEVSFSAWFKRIADVCRDLEDSLMDLDYALSEDDIDSESLVFVLKSDIDKIEELMMDTDNMERFISKRATKRIQHISEVRNTLSNLNEFAVYIVTQNMNTIACNAVKAFDMDERTLYNKITIKNRIQEEGKSSKVTSKTLLYNAILRGL